MNIDDAKKSRAALKSYFVKNAIPTEQQFAQLMDSVLNQRDDGLVKVSGDPLSVEAAGDDTSFKKALNFYTRLSDGDPAWTVSLRPRGNPGDPASGRPGLSINDAAGNSRLAIDAATGRVGIGTVAPGELLDVAVRIKAGPLTIGAWPCSPQYAFVGASTLNQAEQGNYALLQGATADIGRTFLNSPSDIRFRIKNLDQMVLTNAGDVGIGTLTPGAKLDVNGAVRAQQLDVAGPIKAGPLTIGPWPFNPTYAFVGASTLNQADKKNFALLQGAAGSDVGHTFLNSPVAIHFQILNTEQMTLTNSGDVGIGTVAPAAKLDVNGTVRAQLLDVAGGVKAGSLTIGTWPSSSSYAFVGTSTLNQTDQGNYALIQGAVGGDLGRTFLNSPLDIRFRIKNADQMVLTGSGDVGIGTTEPGAKLDVNGTVRAQLLDVAGSIKAGPLGIGAWPRSSAYAFVGVSALNQADGTNYALLQGATAEAGRTYLNSPLDIRFRIKNVDQMVLTGSGDVGIGTAAPEAKLDVIGAVRAQNLLGRRPFRIETGQSAPSDWVVYTAAGIYVDVNTSAAGFTATPRYVTALHGNSGHWSTTGATSVYSASPLGFRIYVQWADKSPLTPAQAAGLGWHIQWIGIQS